MGMLRKISILDHTMAQSRRFVGYFNAPSWDGCFMILSNSSGYDAVQVNLDEKNASSFRTAINHLFISK